MRRAQQWRGELFLGAGSVLYVGPGGLADRHVHDAVQIVHSFGERFELELDGAILNASAAVVPSRRLHKLSSQSPRLAIALVDPCGPRGAAIDRRARALAGKDIVALFSHIEAPRVEADSIVDCGNRLIAALGTFDRPAVSASPHVLSALLYVERELEFRPRLAEAAREAHISASRLTHLFSREVGLPFRRYVLWRRLRRVVELVAAGANLTEAAIAAGFSDSSHLSRVFRSTFGLSPSALLQMQIAADAWPEGRGFAVINSDDSE